MSALMQIYNRFPFEIVQGEGVYLTDNFGKQYLDFTSGIGVCNLGYNHPQLNAAVNTQLGKIWHTSNLYQSSLQEKVAEKLIGNAQKQVFFCNSGTEANEAAIKLARKFTGKSKLLSFHHSFHGRSIGALSVTGNDAIKHGFGELLADIEFAPYNDDAALTQINDQFAAVILEVIQGEGGVTAANANWLQRLAQQCRAAGVLLIIDEVQTGIGRTGKLFAYQHYAIEPDIITLAKGLANGLPCGAMIADSKIAAAFDYGAHGSTFGGNPLAMAAAATVLELMDAALLKNVQQKANGFYQLLEDQLSDCATVEAISGKGLMLGIRLIESVPVKNVVEKLHQQGLLTLSARGNTLRLLPPLVISEMQLQQGLHLIKQVLSDAVAK